MQGTITVVTRLPETAFPLRSRMLKAMSIWDRGTAPETKIKTRVSKKNHGWMDSIHQALQHLKGNTGTCLKRQIYNSCNDIRRGNMGTHQPSKEQASSRTNKDGKEC